VKGCAQEEGEYRLSPSSTSVVIVCVMKLTCAIVHHHHVWVWLKLCGHRRQCVRGDINEQNVVGSGGCFGVVVDVEGPAATTSGMLEGLCFRCY